MSPSEPYEASGPFGDECYQRMKGRLAARVSPKRYEHGKGVAKTAKKLARIYGVDPAKARMAGLVHDWDKCYSGDDSRWRAHEVGLQVDPVVFEQMPWLLHGPTAALALSREFPEWGAEVFQAIARHTSGAKDMTPLDCIIYVADLIEPGRDYGPDSGLDDLRALVGKVPLDELYYQSFKYTLNYLVNADRALFPGATDIYNHLIEQHAAYMREKR